MAKVLIFIIFITFGSSMAKVETNKRGGHGIFHGLEDGNGKSSWLEESKGDNVKINQGNTNSLLSNTALNTKKSSLYLQPEPRGLEYLLDVPDHNPFIFRKRDVSYENVFNKIRKIRQINLQPGNVIPGSRGQAVLYGVPNGNGFAAFPNGQQPIANNQGIPSGLYQNGGFPQGTNGNGVPMYGNGQQTFGNNDQHYGGYKTHGY